MTKEELDNIISNGDLDQVKDAIIEDMASGELDEETALSYEELVDVINAFRELGEGDDIDERIDSLRCFAYNYTEGDIYRNDITITKATIIIMAQTVAAIRGAFKNDGPEAYQEAYQEIAEALRGVMKPGVINALANRINIRAGQLEKEYKNLEAFRRKFSPLETYKRRLDKDKKSLQKSLKEIAEALGIVSNFFALEPPEIMKLGANKTRVSSKKLKEMRLKY